MRFFYLLFSVVTLFPLPLFAQWQQHELVDPMTDARTMVAAYPSDEGTLMVLCAGAGNELAVTLAARRYVNNDGVGQLIYRIDSAPAVTVWGVHSGEGMSITIPRGDAWEMAQAMYTSVEHLHVQWQDYRGVSYIMRADATGLQEALDALPCFDPTAPAPEQPAWGIHVTDPGVVPGSADDPKP